MKQAWVRIQPWDKSLAVAALESGADAVVLDAGDAGRMRELGVMRVVASDGDLVLGRDVVEVTIDSKRAEEQAARIPGSCIVVLRMADWTIIPIENLVAQRGRLFVVVAQAEEARTAVQILEKGVDGVVLETRDPNEVRRVVAQVRGQTERVDLAVARVSDVTILGMGDRVCVDTCTNMEPGEGMLVGNTTEGLFLVHSESLENPYVAARPFRVNAGAVHGYVLRPGGKTSYLSELKAGDGVLVVRHDGRTAVAYVGRSKVERRPLLLVAAEVEAAGFSVVLQNAETIRLTASGGEARSVASLKKGDEVLVHVMGGARHFGMKITETLRER
jgi:3-dehydroquinate synthase II